jgi:hypothetical protein
MAAISHGLAASGGRCPRARLGATRARALLDVPRGHAFERFPLPTAYPEAGGGATAEAEGGAEERPAAGSPATYEYSGEGVRVSASEIPA